MADLYLNRNTITVQKIKMVLFAVIGGFGICFWLLMGIVSMMMRPDDGTDRSVYIAMGFVFFFFAILGVLMVLSAVRTQKRIRKATAYAFVFARDNDGIVTPEELTAGTGSDPQAVFREIEDLIVHKLLINCVMQYSPSPVVMLTVRDQNVVRTMNAYQPVPATCYNCGGQVGIIPGQTVLCPYCNSPITLR
ncbi:MAG: hypothetical protein IJ080_08640 [Oscillospiraceae bacterium]|nr:hypothetical protein [Oscillospiraceae bacterium]